MKFFLKNILVLLVFMASAFANDQTDYFKTLDLVEQQPTDAVFLKPLNDAEAKKITDLDKKEIFDDYIHIRIIYKGDFHNDGSTTYAILNSENIEFLQLKNNHLISLNFIELAENIYGDHDDNIFLMGQILAPFVKDGKTYL